MRIGSVRLFLVRNINEFAKLKMIFVAIKNSNVSPLILSLVNRMGIWRIKNKILALNEAVSMLADSSYNFFSINPRDNISSDIAVIRERSRM